MAFKRIFERMYHTFRGLNDSYHVFRPTQRQKLVGQPKFIFLNSQNNTSNDQTKRLWKKISYGLVFSTPAHQNL